MQKKLLLSYFMINWILSGQSYFGGWQVEIDSAVKGAWWAPGERGEVSNDSKANTNQEAHLSRGTKADRLRADTGGKKETKKERRKERSLRAANKEEKKRISGGRANKWVIGVNLLSGQFQQRYKWMDALKVGHKMISHFTAIPPR